MGDIYFYMKIIISENQHFFLRRYSQFIGIVEEQYEGYERVPDNMRYWWCENNTPEGFLEDFAERCVNVFIDENFDFFHGEGPGADMDIRFLYRFIKENYGNDIMNLFVRKCDHSRF